MRNKMLFYAGAVLLASVVFYGCVKDEISVEEAPIQKEEALLITYDKAEVISEQYIVIYKDNVFPSLRNVSKEDYAPAKQEVMSTTKTILQENKIPSKEVIQSYAKTMKGVAMTLTEEEVARLRNDERVAYIEQDQVISISMGGPPGGGGGGGAQTTPWGISRVGGGLDGTGKRAWILDSGIDLDHEDLNVNVALSASFLSGGSPSSQSPDDQHGHGTHVAGTVAAINNSVGVIGVAAGAEVVAVRVLDRRGSGTTSGVIAGVDYVAANASSGDAANMSLGGGVSTSLDNAVIAASNTCPFAIAAGNESTHANNSSPARANGSNIYTVSSMTSSDNWSSFSNYGNPPVDFCAPGSSVFSTYKDNGYATSSGTSMAAPHVCGLLLIGNVNSDGTVNGDPDGNPDPIAHH